MVGMKLMKLVTLGLMAILLVRSMVSAETRPPVLAPPASFFEMVDEKDREVARAFYKKHIDVNGMPVVSADVVDDLALQRTYEIVTRMLAGRPDIVKALVDSKMYLIVMGRDQVYTDMPENRNHPNPDYVNERVRGTGGRPTSFGEENILSLQLDRYDDESIGVHEFCHTIDGALGAIDPAWQERKRAMYRQAMDKGLWRFSYTAANAGEFWAEACQSYFDCNRVNNYNHGPVGTREQLKTYDPDTYEIVRKTFNLSADQDWRYTYLQSHPSVAAPPAKFEIDPWYTKFTWAREFTVIGRGASDAAMLKANHTIRRLFAYRHDLLKALIADEVKLVVLGKGEKISDLPECASFFKELDGFDALSRMHYYMPETKLLVVDEVNVLADKEGAYVGDDQVIRVFAEALYQVTGTRPVDPLWASRGNAVQQYELRVQRLDVRFDQKLKALHEKAVEAGKWQGTEAIHDHKSYWVVGVLAFFDAVGQNHPPNGVAHPIATREALKTYDPDLHALVQETMAFEGHVDWRLSR